MCLLVFFFVRKGKQRVPQFFFILDLLCFWFIKIIKMKITYTQIKIGHVDAFSDFHFNLSSVFLILAPIRLHYLQPFFRPKPLSARTLLSEQRYVLCPRSRFSRSQFRRFYGDSETGIRIASRDPLQIATLVQMVDIFKRGTYLLPPRQRPDARLLQRRGAPLCKIIN